MYLPNFALTPISRSKVKLRSKSCDMCGHNQCIPTKISHNRSMYVAAVSSLSTAGSTMLTTRAVAHIHTHTYIAHFIVPLELGYNYVGKLVMFM